MKNKNWQRQHMRFIALLIGIFILLGLLAVRYDRSVDITFSQRHVLSPQSIKIVKQLTEPVAVTAFVRGNPKVEKMISRLLEKYQQHADMSLVFKNPDTAVDLVREYGITRDGELVFEYQGQRAHAPDLSETSMTRAIYQLLRSEPRRVLFVTGHGERGGGNTQSDYAAFFDRLREADINVGQVDLKLTKKVPSDIDLLVIADAHIDFDDVENEALKNYITNGGRLLWLAEPDSARLPGIVSQLGISVQEKTLINRSAKKYSLSEPDYIVIEPQKSDLPMLKDINMMLLFPQSAPVSVLPTEASAKWQALPLLSITEKSFVKSNDTIEKAPTPTLLGVFLTAVNVEQTQKVVVIGDADFLSNQFIGFGQNAEFAINLFNYLSAPEDVLAQVSQPLPPAVIIPTQTLGYLAIIFIIVVPILLMLFGFWVRRWLRRDV